MITASGGTGYQWSNGGNSAKITVNPSINTSYTVTVTDANNCSSTRTTQIVVNPLPNAAIVPLNPSNCSGKNIILTASGGTGYSWSTGGMTDAITVAPVMNTTYTVTVTDANGCTKTASSTVNVLPNPGLSENHIEPTTCVSTDGSINLTVTPTGTYTYAWIGPNGYTNNIEDISGLVAGGYSVTVTSSGNGCASVLAVTLNGPGGCNVCPAIGILTTTPANEACDGMNVNLLASGLSNMGNTYGITFKRSNVVLADPYSGGTIIATIPNASLGGGGTTATTNHIFPGTGTYYLYAILSPVPTDISCRPSASRTLVINPTPVVNITPAVVNTCQGQPVNMNGNPSGGTGTYTHLWTGTGAAFLSNTGIVNPIFNCPTPGTYSLTYTVTDSKGCSASSTRSVTVTNCTLSIKDPCSCLNNATTLTNGQFSELVQVNAPSGQSWSVSAVSGLFLNSSPPPPAAPLAIPIGTTLTVGTADGIDNDNDGQFDEADENVYYTLRGKHVDAIGYTVSVTNSLGVTLSIGNTCYYPNPQINGLNANYCITDPAVVLNGSATLGDGSGPASGVGVFRVNGVVNTVFNPASVGLGNHTVQYCFDAADNVPNNRHPGCTQCVSQAVTVNGPPTISCPAPLTVGCAIDVPAPNPASVVVTSNPCASPATVTHVSDVISNQTCANRYVVTRTYRAVNSCCPGSAVTCTQIITVNDITAPSVVCPPPVTVQCASAVPPVNVASVITADHCGNVGIVVTHVGDVITNMTCANRFTVTRTYRSTDVCGNSGTCAQVITVFDNTAPVVVCRNITIFLDANGNATVTPQQLLSSVSDNCTATPAIVITAVPSSFTCANIGPNNVNLRATDECGNVGTCLAVVTVVDNLPPVIMGCPTKSPVTINLGPGECEASWDAPPFMAMDNCPAGAYFGNRNTTTVCLPPASYWSITGGAASWGVMFDLINTSGSLLNLQLLGERAFANVPHNIYYTRNPGGHAPVVATPNAWTLCATRTPTSGAQFTTVIDSFRLLTGTRTDTIKRCAPIQTETTVLGCLTMAPGETRGIYIHAPGTGGTNASLFSGCAARPMGDANINTPINGATYTGGQFAAPFINSSFGFGGANWMGVIGYNLANSNRVPLVQTCGAPYGPGCFFPIGCTKLCYRATDASGNVGTCEFEVCVNKYANPTRALACNDDIQISLDDSCRATIYPDMVLEGGPYSCYDDYIVEVRDWKGGPLIDREPNRRGVQINGNDIGRELKITIIDPVTGNSCWGHGRVEDKIAPKMTCPPDISLSCASSTAPIVAGLPSVYENCGGANIGYHDSEVQGGCPQGYARRITRTWTATDASGNKSVCVQTITVKIGDLFEVTVPSNYDNLDQPALECDEKIDRNKNVTPHMADFPECVDGYILDSAFWLANPNAPDQYPNRRLPRVLGWNCIDDLNDPHYGHPSPDPVYYPQHRQWSPNNPLCWGPDRHIMWVGTGRPGGAECSNLTVTYKDIVFDLATPGCDAGPIGCYKVLRQWTVMDWCTSQLGGHNQIIKVIDDEGPQVLYPDSARVNMESWTCTGRWEVPAPWILDNCSNEVHYTVEVDNGTVLGDETAGFVVLDMPEGIYNGYIVATDCCGNITKKRIVLNVIDRVPPQAVCRTATVVSLSGNQSPLTNYARLHAEDLDEGSFDNCQPHVYFKVIRMAELLGTNNGSNSNNVVACQGRNGDDNSILAGNQIYFDDYTDFCCADVGTKVMVVLRVFDVDPGAGPVTPIRMTSTSSVLNGRFSDCMVEVEVQNKAVPTVIAPPNIVVSCWFWFDVTKLTNPNDATFGKVVTSLTDRRKVVTKDLVCYKFCERNDYTGYPGYVQTNAQPKPAPNQACEYYYQYFDTAHWDRKYELVWGFDGYVLSPCGSTPTITVNDLRECGQGVIQRIISTTGPNNINVTAIQTIWVVDCDPFYIDDVACNDPRYTDLLWPNGMCTQTPVTLDGCGADISPDNPQLGRPQVINNADDNCALLSIEYFDEQFNIEPDACFKVLRRWVVIDWCQYDPFIDPNHGRWEALQVIKVRDQNRPVVSCSVGPCEPAKIDSKLGVCVGHISLTASATDNCTPADWLFWEYKIDAFNDGKGVHGGYDFRVGTLTSKQYAAGDTVEYSHNPFADDSHNPFNASGTYPIGIHKIKWFVEDGCGNVGVCESLFEIKDCKAPTPYCLTGVITVPMPSSGCVDIWAKDLDKGSYDNCTSQENLKFYFDEDPTKPSLSICCQDFIDKKVNDELILEVELWVEDEEGNKDYCKTIIVVQDNQDICPDKGSAKGKISGNIKTETGVETRPVEVSLFHNGSMMRQMMGSPYSFGDLVMNTTYSVKPERNDDHANGVTTQDIVKIQKHILGQAEITDPYKLLAADVNASKTITASDMAELRKLILGINSEFKKCEELDLCSCGLCFCGSKITMGCTKKC
ncbi:MAG: HYR domain-containing protein [Saprospiraceae bacterium]|nr:HYR domain-containing protein [Candidatus Vicinibacter affinis]